MPKLCVQWCKKPVAEAVRRGAVVASALALVAAALAAQRLRLSPGRDLIVVLDGGSSRLARANAFRQLLHPQPSEQLLIRCPQSPSPLQPMPELPQGYDTATQITALALWIVTDPEHTARATLLARIA